MEILKLILASWWFFRVFSGMFFFFFFFFFFTAQFNELFLTEALGFCSFYRGNGFAKMSGNSCGS